VGIWHVSAVCRYVPGSSLLGATDYRPALVANATGQFLSAMFRKFPELSHFS
jgi:hypothetical protein